MTHVGARYYDASGGRFITRDTLLNEKAYTYCEGDPLNFVDPSGHVANPLAAVGETLGTAGFAVAGIGLVGYVIGAIGDVVGCPVLSHAGQVIGDIGMVAAGVFLLAAGGPAILLGLGLLCFILGSAALAKHIGLDFATSGRLEIVERVHALPPAELGK